MNESLLAAHWCAAYPVLNGECPNCSTYYFARGDGKRFGVRPTSVPLHEGTSGPISVDLVANAFRCAP